MWTSVSFSKTPALDHEYNVTYRQACEEIRTFTVGNQYKVDCFHNYHHYNSQASQAYYSEVRARNAGKVKMGSFNLWHPGTSKSGFKDYDLVAKVMNQWDIVAAQELLPIVGEDLRLNQLVLDFLQKGPALVEDKKQKILASRNVQERERLEEELVQLELDLKEAPNLYRSPGYLKILESLRKLDPSWALMLSPRGEAAEAFHVHEVVGYFYRASNVKPVVNSHCREYKEQSRNGVPYACIPNFYQNFMGRNTAPAFSRRPFMASFQSGRFDFTLLSSHVIFTSPRVPEKVQEIMRIAFDKPDYEDLGAGFNLATYARFAEVKLTLEFMQNFANKYKNSNIIYMGDMNLESNNSFWPEVLKEFDGGQVFVDEATSMTQIRFRSGGIPSNGVTSNYDHFLFSPKLTPQCVNKQGKSDAKAFNFYESWVRDYIEKEYMIRLDLPESIGLTNYVNRRKFENDEMEPIFNDDPGYGSMPIADDFVTQHYEIRPGSGEKISKKMREHVAFLEQRRTIRYNKIVWDDSRFEQRLVTYKSRIFLDQLNDRTYYRIYYELISDHFPISMSCSTK